MNIINALYIIFGCFALWLGVTGFVSTFKKSRLEKKIKHYRHLYSIDALTREDMDKWRELLNEYEKLIKK